MNLTYLLYIFSESNNQRERGFYMLAIISFTAPLEIY